MGSSRVRRVQAGQGTGSWIDPWIDVALVKRSAIKFGRASLEWSWLTGLLSSALWVLALFLISDLPLAYEVSSTLNFDPDLLGNKVVAITCLLLLHATLGILYFYRALLPRSGVIGLALMCAGFLWAALISQNIFMSSTQGVSATFVGDEQFGRIKWMTHMSTGFPQLVWSSGAGIGFLVVSLGLILFYAGAIRTRILTGVVGAFLMAIASIIHLPALFMGIAESRHDLDVLIFWQNIFTVLVMLFAVNWIRAGITLLQHQRKKRQVTQQ